MTPRRAATTRCRRTRTGPSAGPDAIAAIAARLRLRSIKLLTLTGAGGVGKTRLAPEVARAVEGDFTEADICRRVDGLPLGIELAAARCALLTPAEIAERLDAALGALAPGLRDAPDRQRTLRATIAWSHDLLSPTSGRASRASRSSSAAPRSKRRRRSLARGSTRSIGCSPRTCSSADGRRPPAPGSRCSRPCRLRRRAPGSERGRPHGRRAALLLLPRARPAPRKRACAAATARSISPCWTARTPTSAPHLSGRPARTVARRRRALRGARLVLADAGSARRGDRGHRPRAVRARRRQRSGAARPLRLNAAVEAGNWWSEDDEPIVGVERERGRGASRGPAPGSTTPPRTAGLCRRSPAPEARDRRA